MITNERQYKITCAQLNKLKNIIDSFDHNEALKRVGDERLVKAQLDALKSEYENLNIQIMDYDSLKSGDVEILKASSLEELPILLIRARIAKGLSQRDLAQILGMKEQQIQRYESEEYASTSLTRLIEVANALELNIKEIADFGNPNKPIDKIHTEVAWDQFPIKEMYRRNYFEGFSGSMSDAINNSEELLSEHLSNSLNEPVKAAAKQQVRFKGRVNQYALIAWQCRVINLAKEIKIKNKFEKRLLSDEWFRNLIKLSSKKDWAQRTKHYLSETGIRLIILPHLTHTHLDGAVFLIKLGPIVGMTLRYDRLDNFWFVLIHELAHIKHHLSKGKLESIFDDLDVEADDIEKEADEITSEFLVSSEIWETALARYIQSKETIEEFSKELGINSAIVAGRIRKEADNYTILNDLVGQGEVRKEFSEVDFSY